MGNKDLSGTTKIDRDGDSNVRQCTLQGKSHSTGQKKIYF